MQSNQATSIHEEKIDSDPLLGQSISSKLNKKLQNMRDSVDLEANFKQQCMHAEGPPPPPK